MNDTTPVIIIVAGCCLFPTITFLIGLFGGWQIKTRQSKQNSPAGTESRTASGRFVVDE
jgi:hypothetical protein